MYTVDFCMVALKAFNSRIHKTTLTYGGQSDNSGQQGQADG